MSLNPEDFRNELQEIYRSLDADVARLAPVCAISGRCCRFVEYDHTLFVSAPEFAILIADAPPPVRPLDDGATCPWQDERGRCTAREARPLGCRVYFCDPSYAPHGPDLAEAAIARLKQLVAAMDLPWDYAPLHRHLHQAMTDERYPGSPEGRVDCE